jgi:hypothetical protein
MITNDTSGLSLTPWYGVFHEQLAVAQLVKNVLLYGT